MDFATVGIIITFATLVLTSVLQYMREGRNRRWDMETKQTLVEHAQVVAGKIDENTNISTKAFHEANTVNLKLEKLGLTHDDGIKELIAKSDVQDGDIRDLIHEVQTETVARKKADDAKVIDGLKDDIGKLKNRGDA